MPVPAFQFQQLCQIPAMSVENTISTQKDPAAICKLSLILKKRLRRLIALSCLILLCPAESQHSREWQLYETPELAVLVKKPALSLIMQLNNNNNWINDNAVVPPRTWLGLVITLQGTHWAGIVILWESGLPTMQRSWNSPWITAAHSTGSLNSSKLFTGGSFYWGTLVFVIIITTIITHIHVHPFPCICSCGDRRSVPFSQTNFHRQMWRRTFSTFLVSQLVACSR